MAIDLRSASTGVVMSGPVIQASQEAPATATYGPTGATVVDTGAATHPANFKVYAGVAALAGLVLVRQSAPQARRREVDTIVVVAFLLNVAITGLKLNAKRKVQNGETGGISGFLAQAWSV